MLKSATTNIKALRLDEGDDDALRVAIASFLPLPFGLSGIECHRVPGYVILTRAPRGSPLL